MRSRVMCVCKYVFSFRALDGCLLSTTVILCPWKNWSHLLLPLKEKWYSLPPSFFHPSPFFPFSSLSPSLHLPPFLLTHRLLNPWYNRVLSQSTLNHSHYIYIHTVPIVTSSVYSKGSLILATNPLHDTQLTTYMITYNCTRSLQVIM